MIANPFTTVAQKAIIVVLGVLLVALAAAAGMLWWDLRSTERALLECQNTTAGLVARVDEQNRAVQGWQAAASSAQATTRAALDTARRAGAANKPELKRLADLIAGAKSTECGPAMQEIREGLR